MPAPEMPTPEMPTPEMQTHAILATRPFLFDRSFDTGMPEQADAPAAPPPPAFTLADLEQARLEAHAQGRAAALAEAHAQMQADRGRDAILGIIAERLSALHAGISAAAAQAGCDAVRIAGLLVGKLMPDLCARHGGAEIEAMVDAALAHVPAEQMITIRLAPSTSGELAPLLMGRAQQHGLAERVRVCGDAAIAPGDCALEWRGGGVMRDQSSLWRDIEALLAETIGETQGNAAGETAALDAPSVSGGTALLTTGEPHV